MGKRNAIIGLGSAIVWASAAVAQAQEAPAPAPSATAAPASHPSTPAQPTASNAPAPAVNPDPAPSAADAAVARLEAELASVLDELIQARTRTASLVKTLFRTPIEVRVVRRADAQRLVHIALRLDGVPVHDSDGSALASGEAQLFSGFAAPGVHELTVEVTEEAKERSAYRYTRVERFRLEVAKETRTQIELVMRDDSDMAEELPEGDEGEYDVRTILRARAEKVSER
jgi:hypothetical protein